MTCLSPYRQCPDNCSVKQDQWLTPVGLQSGKQRRRWGASSSQNSIMLNIDRCHIVCACAQVVMLCDDRLRHSKNGRSITTSATTSLEASLKVHRNFEPRPYLLAYPAD
eukprot:COSAG02_NODE_106_length_36326_cov_13.777266_33_plen_109_part_00